MCALAMAAAAGAAVAATSEFNALLDAPSKPGLCRARVLGLSICTSLI